MRVVVEDILAEEAMAGGREAMEAEISDMAASFTEAEIGQANMDPASVTMAGKEGITGTTIITIIITLPIIIMQTAVGVGGGERLMTLWQVWP